MSNNLGNETSSYLQEHAKDLINWYPWNSSALLKAKAENKPIFLYISDSGSHLSQIMSKESFHNETIIQLLNERFVSIWVDKHERPDIDKYYQKVYYLMNRRIAGTPLSIFMTQNLEPFYAATYIAPDARREEFGFEELLRSVSKKYITEYETLVEKGNEILANVDSKNKNIEATKLHLNIMKTITLHIDNLLDKQEGGFGTSSKFPNASLIELILDQYQLHQEADLLDATLLTLNSMTKGGFYDHIEGGFFRYSTDNKWLVPHFVKTTYDNAQLITLYLRAFELTQNNAYKHFAFETLAFMNQKLSHQNLFYASLNAPDDEYQDYYTYEYDSVVQLLEEHNYSRLEITQICSRLNLTTEGVLKGTNIVRIDNLENLDRDYYTPIFSLLQTNRETKHSPNIDKNIITSWNAMMISALFQATLVDTQYRELAIASLDSLLETLYINGTLYHNTLLGKTPSVKAFLEDYAYLGETLVTAYQVTLNEKYLILATELTNSAIEQFYEHGEWKFSNGEINVKETIYDTTYPSSIATMLSLLLSIASLVDINYKKFVFKTLEFNSYNLMRQPLSSPKLTQMLLRYLKDDIIIKSNEHSLHKHIHQKNIFDYPYLLYKVTMDETFYLANSHSPLGTSKLFENLKSLISHP